MRFNTQLRPAGYVVIVDPDPGRGQPTTVEHDTLMCAHCGCHFTLVKPSLTNLGTVPGTCWSCGAAPICGKPECVNHVPMEQMIENLEQGRPRDYIPTQVAVPTSKLWLPAT